MSIKLPIQKVLNIINSAFRPLRCSAESYDYEHRVRFRVFDASEEPILRVEDVLVEQFTDPNRLEQIISEARNNLIRRNFELNKWKFPTEGH